LRLESKNRRKVERALQAMCGKAFTSVVELVLMDIPLCILKFSREMQILRQMGYTLVSRIFPDSMR